MNIKFKAHILFLILFFSFFTNAKTNQITATSFRFKVDEHPAIMNTISTQQVLIAMEEDEEKPASDHLKLLCNNLCDVNNQLSQSLNFSQRLLHNKKKYFIPNVY